MTVKPSQRELSDQVSPSLPPLLFAGKVTSLQQVPATVHVPIKSSERLLFKNKGGVSFGLLLWLSWERIHLPCRRPGFDPWVGIDRKSVV